MIDLYAIYMITTGVLLGSLGGIVLKKGSLDIEYQGTLLSIAVQIISNWKILLGLLLYFIPAVIWIVLLKKMEISLLQPIFSMTYVLTPFLAILFLNEHVSQARWLGIGVIITGVVIVARS